MCGHEQIDLLVGQIAAAQQANGLGSEGGASLAANGHKLVSGHADVVLRIGIGHTVGQGLWIWRGDVRNSVRGSRDGRAAFS
ncbi:hypothetical protein D9M68_924190 [compost metagenome]